MKSRNQREGKYAGHADGHRRAKGPSGRAFIWPSSVLARYIMPEDDYETLRNRLINKTYLGKS